MLTLFVLLFLVAIIALIVGLIKPSWVIKWGERKTRPRVLLYYGLGTLVFFFLIGITVPSTQQKNTGIDNSSISLKESNDNYDKGKQAFDSKDWDNAKKNLILVIKKDSNYKDAQDKLAKIDKIKESADAYTNLGSSSQTASSKSNLGPTLLQALTDKTHSAFKFSAITVDNVNSSNNTTDYSKNNSGGSSSVNSGNTGLFKSRLQEVVIWTYEGKAFVHYDGNYAQAHVTNNNGELLINACISSGNGVSNREWKFDVRGNNTTGSASYSTTTVVYSVGRSNGLFGNFKADIESISKDKWPPAPIEKLERHRINNTVVLKWQPVSFLNDASTSYKIYRKIDGDQSEILIATVKENSFTDNTPELRKNISRNTTRMAVYRVTPINSLMPTDTEGSSSYIAISLDSSLPSY